MDNEEKAIYGLAIGFLFIAALCWIGFSAMEARSFNNVTGKKVSTFDAMFISLRVQEPSK